MLELKNIYKTFNPGSINEKRALNGINLTLEDGDFVTIIGGNGAGKSTMLNAIAARISQSCPNTKEQNIWGAYSRIP